LAWAGDGLFVCANDGTVAYFDEGQSSVAMKLDCRDVMASIDARDHFVVVRSEAEGRVVLFDARNADSPIWSFRCSSSVQSVGLSPDGAIVLACEMVSREAVCGGGIRLISVADGVEQEQVMFPAGVGGRCCQWNRATNQIAVGCSDGITRVLFDCRLSRNGVLLSLEHGIAVKNETDEAAVGQLVPQLVDPETERVIGGFWFPFTDAAKRDKRAAQEPKAPLWGEGHHGQIATAPLQVQLKELYHEDEPDDTDIVESLRARNKAAEAKYFTSVRKQPR
jgi:hypothetical protein